MRDALKLLIAQKDATTKQVKEVLKKADHYDALATKHRELAVVMSDRIDSLNIAIKQVRESTNDPTLPDDEDLLREVQGLPSKAEEAALAEEAQAEIKRLAEQAGALADTKTGGK